jgi:hypothetical protein
MINTAEQFCFYLFIGLCAIAVCYLIAVFTEQY